VTERIIWNCRQVVTLAGTPGPRTGPAMRELALIPDGALLIRGHNIQAVGTLHEIEAMCSASTEAVDAGGRIVLPGFVDAHTHPVFAGTRADEFEQRAAGVTYTEIAARGGGIPSTVRRTVAACPAALLQSARRYRTRFLCGGTTTIEAKSGYGLSLEAELKILRVIQQLDQDDCVRYVATFLAHGIPDEFRATPDAYVDCLVDEMLPRVRQERLAEYCDVFCDPSVFPLEKSRLILQAARRLGFGIRMHADQFRCDGGARLAADLGAATADHLEYTDSDGLEALHSAGVQPVLLPASVYSLGSQHYPAARQMIDLGLAVVLATDFNPGTSPTTSIPMVLSLACTQMHLTPAEAITAATINAACSLGRGDQIGSLEPGKSADFVIHDCDDYRELAYFFGRDPAYAVYLGGTCVYGQAVSDQPSAFSDEP
jgi:imidazolonepropionase